MRPLFLFFFSITTALAQQPDSVDRQIPEGYRIFYVNDSVEYIVIGKKDNRLFGTPRNDGSAEAMSANENFLKNNAIEIVWMLDRSISLERVKELYRQNPKGRLGVILYFTPEPKLKEIYFNFRGFGGKVPLAFDEIDMLNVFISNNIGAWYQEHDRVFEQLVQRQYYIEWPWDLMVQKLLEYKKGAFRLDVL
ncbi:hypothetical protein [Parapedobacter sp. DT-150]|uniref:hypothetical protein n=1 Tax=Parapedobacter sp. DT-150 TaxID=3396162 RepID=UPI003F1DBFF8